MAEYEIKDVEDVRIHFDDVRSTFDPERFPDAAASLQALATAAARAATDAEDAANYRALRNCARMRTMGYAGRIRPGDKSPNAPGHVHLGMEFWSHHPAATEPLSLEIFDRFVAILRDPTKTEQS